MKKITVASVLALIFMGNYSFAAQGPICAEKSQRIQEQIEYAEKHGNSHRIQGLQRALEKNNRYCNDAKELKEQESKVAEKQEKVNKRIAELEQEKRGNKPDKVAKRERKLEQAKAELAEVQKELDAMKAL